MSRLVRNVMLCATILVGASLAAKSGIPSPFFPPDPWEEEDPGIASNSIPSPFFPPDPWEEEEVG